MIRNQHPSARNKHRSSHRTTPSSKINGVIVPQSFIDNPTTISKELYMQFQGRVESMDRDRAQGQDCVEGFEAEANEVDCLMKNSPWTLSHDHGCMLTADAAEFDAVASIEGTVPS